MSKNTNETRPQNDIWGDHAKAEQARIDNRLRHCSAAAHETLGNIRSLQVLLAHAESLAQQAYDHARSAEVDHARGVSPSDIDFRLNHVNGLLQSVAIELSFKVKDGVAVEPKDADFRNPSPNGPEGADKWSW